MKNKKKMAIICSTDYKSYPMGGMMSFILDTLPHLKDEFEITLWGVSIKEKPVNSIMVKNDSYPFKVFSNVKTEKKIIPNLIRVSYNIWKMRKEILSDNYDMLYIHGIPLSFPFFKNENVKVVNHIHGLPNPFSILNNKIYNNYIFISLYDKYRKWIIKKSDLVLLASDKQGYKIFSKNFPDSYDKIHYLPNFADKNIFYSIKKNEARKILNITNFNENILVNTGRISSGKDPVLLIKSFIYLIRILKIKARLVIIGDGDMKKEIEQMVKDNQLESYITITGKLNRNKINLWLNASDLYVFTSVAEGYPISLAEAASCGLPIVTTDVTGVHDLVVNDKSGYLVPHREPRAIAEAIQKALENKVMFSENIYEISKNFSPKIIIDRMKQMFLSELDR
jgi:glycosyltransferase involved in cell wall biosynthesis